MSYPMGGKSNAGYQNRPATHVCGLLRILKGHLLYFEPEGGKSRSNGGPIGEALEEHWMSIGGALDEHWRSIGGALEEHWRIIGGALEEYGRSIG